MQLNSDTLPTFSGKKVKSSSNFYKPSPTYVVAFALKETYDDLVTAQQMICNKRSPQASTNSITPTNSLKLLDSTQTVKLEQIPSLPESNDKVVEENIAVEESNPATLESKSSESNTEDVDQNKIIPFIETDETTDSSNDENADNGEKADNNENADKMESPENAEKSNQPEIIFNAINYTKRNSKFLTRKLKIIKIIPPKCNKFKCKTPKNNISNRLEKYCEKAKQNAISSELIRERFSNISTVVSRTRVLKNVLAKENLLDVTEFTMINDPLQQFNVNDDSSQSSFPSTAKNDSFISNSSGNTLTQVSSRTSSKLEDPDAVKSAIEMPSEITPPYKTDVINVAVAVAYNKSKNVTPDEKIRNNEKFMHLTSLTSQSPESLTMELSKLTSEIPSDCQPVRTLEPVSSIKKTAPAKDMSNITLVNRKSCFDLSSEDSFDMARTSSEINENTISISTLKQDMGHESNHEIKELEDDENPNKRHQSILETVIGLGYYPEVSPSTSSRVTVTVANQKDVFITDASQKYQVCSKNMGDHRKESKTNANVLKKTFNNRENSPTKKPLNLPNHDNINEMLIDDMQKMKYPEESKNPFSIPEMWDKLIVVLDVAFKRLETTITEKIIKELKNSIASLEFRAQPIPEVNMDLEKGDIIVIEPPIQEVISTEEFKETDRSLQCNLVQSEFIDKIMQTLSTQEPKIIEPGKSVKSLKKIKSKLIREYLEVLKPPLVVGPEVSQDKGDTVTISTVRTETFDRIQRLSMFFFRPIRFVRENLFVIASVPAFFVVLLFVYGILMLLIKP